jgi:hypothetical protein
MFQNLLVSLVFVFGLGQAFAGEESLDLDTVAAPTPAPSAAHGSKFSIMGRIDLTYEKEIEGRSSLKNNHMLVFVKVKASDKVSVMGEVTDPSAAFMYVDYAYSKLLNINFGRILVPFGDSRYFHKYYGGLQGYGANGVMFPNIWAESGVNFAWNFGALKLDTYWVNAVGGPTRTTLTTADINLQSTSTRTQALGARATISPIDKTTLILSAYGAEYWPSRPVYLGGVDFSTDYGLLGPVRFSAGLANAWIEGSPTGENFQKTGDYYQIATNIINPMEMRVRYGTYDNDDRRETQEDTQSLNVGVTFPVDVMKILIEHQWNYEEVNETDNDLGRVMVSLDF